jgi:hypothetical protein
MIYWVTQVTGGLRIYKNGNVFKVIAGYVRMLLDVIVFPQKIFVTPRGLPNTGV